MSRNRNTWHLLPLAILAWLGVESRMAAQGPSPRSDGREQVRPLEPVSPLAGNSDDITASTFWTSGRYRITPGDVLELTFPLVPEFNQLVSVQPDGYVSLLSIGDVRVQGRTVRQVKDALVEAYESILLKPELTVVLKEFEKPYFIAAGEVAKPGKYELRGATTVTQALAVSGGQTRAARTSQVLLFRQYGAALVEVKEVNVKRMYARHDLAEDYLLRPGDTVFVPRTAWSKVAPFLPRPSLGMYLNPFAW
jgi:polysaccharide biosynthesis/export protein